MNTRERARRWLCITFISPPLGYRRGTALTVATKQPAGIERTGPRHSRCLRVF
ncbi:hypothetical protein AAGW04_22505 [Pectobacterium aroidearum]|uniref:hypothetical protein n=1 Tax=Pectobacterium aroidearum TaxID=1201031 RepID=UPI003158EF3E